MKLEVLKQSILTAKLAVERANEVLKSHFGSLSTYETKSSFCDLVTQADRESQQVILETIASAHPGHRVLSEEGPPESCDWTGPLWVVDPLDGTTNFAHGYPFFCISIALLLDGVSLLGIVSDPMRGELFYAVRGEGAFLNDSRLVVSSTNALSQSLLATGFAYDRSQNSEQTYREFADLTQRTHGVRRDGAAALDLAYVAAGRFEGFWERQLKPWDMAAGELLVSEAGGIVSSIDGTPLSLERGNILATNPKIYSELRAVLGGKSQ